MAPRKAQRHSHPGTFSLRKTCIIARMATHTAPVRRTLIVLFLGHGLAMAGVFTSSAISSITAVQLAGSDRVAGWPSTVWLLGAALAAYPAGRLMGRYGR